MPTPIRSTHRFRWLLAAGYCLFLASGCWWMSSPSSPSASSSESAESEKQSDSLPVSNRKREIVSDWPVPKLAILFTGEQQGYLEPCGCSETQSGGISRRADLFRQLREDKHWNVIGLDLGDTMKRSRKQDQIKFGVLHSAMSQMGYRAMGLGPSDLKLEVDFLFSTVPDSINPETPLPYVSSNVVFYGEPDIGSPARFRIVEENGLKVGITSFLGEKYAGNIFPEGNNSANALLKVEPAVSSLQPVIKHLQAEKCDLIVLLAQATKPETESVLKSVPGIDVCLTGGGPEDPAGTTLKIGETLVLEAGRKGKYAGVLGYYPQDPQQKFRFELIDLDKDRFRRTPEMEAQMAFYQDLLKQQQIIETEPAVPHSSGKQFVGSAQCGECHTKAYAHWKTTKHAHATETLVSGTDKYKETEWINRIHDPECLACHVVGWDPQEVFRYESGFTTLEKSLPLAGQGCENCHGPGSKHTQLELAFRENRQNTPEIQAERASMKIDLVHAERNVCRKCHDAENSPNFDFAKYWQKVVHHGKD